MPGTDWWPNLMQGLVGAVIAAVAAGVVSFYVARYVVKETKKADMQQARHLAALAAAEDLWQAAYDAVDLAAQYFDAGRPDDRPQERAAVQWGQFAARKAPALNGYVDLEPLLTPLTQELDRHAALGVQLRARHQQLKLDPATLELKGSDELTELWRASVIRVKDAAVALSVALSTFRASHSA